MKVSRRGLLISIALSAVLAPTYFLYRSSKKERFRPELTSQFLSSKECFIYLSFATAILPDLLMQTDLEKKQFIDGCDQFLDSSSAIELKEFRLLLAVSEYGLPILSGKLGWYSHFDLENRRAILEKIFTSKWSIFRLIGRGIKSFIYINYLQFKPDTLVLEEAGWCGR